MATPLHCNCDRFSCWEAQTPSSFHRWYVLASCGSKMHSTCLAYVVRNYCPPMMTTDYLEVGGRSGGPADRSPEHLQGCQRGLKNITESKFSLKYRTKNLQSFWQNTDTNTFAQESEFQQYWRSCKKNLFNDLKLLIIWNRIRVDSLLPLASASCAQPFFYQSGTWGGSNILEPGSNVLEAWSP